MRLVALAVSSMLLAGCSCGAPTVIGDDDAATQVDAAIEDASIGPGACTPSGARVWRLGDGVWSTDFAPRGVAARFPISAAVHDGNIFLAGLFDHAGPIAARNVAVWSETEGFRALPDGVVSDFVSSIAVAPDGTVMVGTVQLGPTGVVSAYELDVLRSGSWSVIAQGEAAIGPAVPDVDGSMLIAG